MKNQIAKKGRGWDAHAKWYDGMVGDKGSKHHQELAIPAVLGLLQPQPGEKIIDVGCGQGVLAPYITRQKAKYVGVDISANLINMAKKRHAKAGEFEVVDASKLHKTFDNNEFDAAVFLLSIQDMPNLEASLHSLSQVMKQQSRVVLLMLHPAFRIPRQSGWGYDNDRKLNYRRVDSYLSRLNVPLKKYPGKQQGSSISYHRPLQDYVNGLADHGFLVDGLIEVPGDKTSKASDKSMNRAVEEIPLFLGIRARKI